MQPAGSFYSIQDSDVESSPTIIQGRMSLKILAKSSGPQGARDFLMLRLPLFNP